MTNNERWLLVQGVHQSALRDAMLNYGNQEEVWIDGEPLELHPSDTLKERYDIHVMKWIKLMNLLLAEQLLLAEGIKHLGPWP